MNPFTKLPGYVSAKYDPLNGRFVVQRCSEAGAQAPDPRLLWCVSCLRLQQIIFCRSRREAEEIMYQGLDGVYLDKWRHEFAQAGSRGSKSHLPQDET